jgi:hypothetical protein
VRNSRFLRPPVFHKPVLLSPPSLFFVEILYAVCFCATLILPGKKKLGNFPHCTR